MSTISNLIFNNAKHYVTSKYGYRDPIQTPAGVTRSFHYGTDYGTDNKKLPQYAIEDGTIVSCGRDTAENAYALFIWVAYPRINKKLLHYHLDSISVKAGQKVKKGTLLGYTGMTGRATGIHLHLGMKDLTTNQYEDPEAFVYPPKAVSFFPARGYFKRGDVSPNVGRIATFMRLWFPAYTSKLALGDTYGKYLQASIITFQKNTGSSPTVISGP